MKRQSVVIKPEDISTDDLWLAAKYDVVIEREGIDGLDKHFNQREKIIAEQLFRVILSNSQFDSEYAGILESAFENYDVDNS